MNLIIKNGNNWLEIS